MARRAGVTERQKVRTLAAESGVELGAIDRAIVISQIAELLSRSPRIGTRVAFKGGAVMSLVEHSPRTSRDLDSNLVIRTGRRVTLEDVENALTTPEARRVVVEVQRKSATVAKDGMKVPVIVCRPKSGQGTVQMGFSVKWGEPVLLDPVHEEVTVGGETVRLFVMARPERIAEKTRAYVNRGEHRDAFDLHLYGSKWMSAKDWLDLPDLVARKLELDPKSLKADEATSSFDAFTAGLATTWDTERNPLRLLEVRPPWEDVHAQLVRFRAVLPSQQVSTAT